MRRPIEAGILGRALRPPSSASAPAASKHSAHTFLWPGGLILFLWRPNVLSKKRPDHTWWEIRLEPCVFFVLECTC